MKDVFSEQSGDYAKFRPHYPDELFDFLLSIAPDRENAWDCGTGNGQVAEKLSGYFREVEATDISQPQLDQARPQPNIRYSLQPAEKTVFADRSFDLITVAQAIHWFDFDAFYREVNRTLRPGGILAVIGYGLLHITPELDTVIRKLYVDILGQYWDRERKYIDENYLTIPFPYPPFPTPYFAHSVTWSWGHLTGYLSTWSAVQHYMKAHQHDPIAIIADELKDAWGEPAEREIHFPVLLRIGKI
ncbi:class I SAM-dependent methyltransferase [Chitinophaga deserti]|uniref:class I SAM-dependent methyltransferase n=1 Tax=Chitinophaga deserti TaxID=2164099 RepID=UPI000D6BB82D|nr:class I SAM-dependent methyltransferase [Chitinophaga deserti]